MRQSLSAHWLETEFGRILVARSERGVCFVHLSETGAREGLEEFCERHGLGPCPVPKSAAESDGVDLDQLTQFLAGQRDSFDLPLDLMGTPFQIRCWKALLKIPYGETCTYADLARAIGMPAGAARAVGQANGANPIPIVVPCHRVVAHAGLGGYAGGLDLKRRLLALEGALVH